MYEQVGTEELGNDDYGDSVDYEEDNVTLEPISSVLKIFRGHHNFEV